MPPRVCGHHDCPGVVVFAVPLNEVAQGLAESVLGEELSTAEPVELINGPHVVGCHIEPCHRAFRDARAQRRAVDWLVDNSLIDDAAAVRFLTDHPDPDVP